MWRQAAGSAPDRLGTDMYSNPRFSSPLGRSLYSLLQGVHHGSLPKQPRRFDGRSEAGPPAAFGPPPKAPKGPSAIVTVKNMIVLTPLFLLLFTSQGLSAVVTVKNLNDSGPDSLRAAVRSANSQANSTINFAPNLHGTIQLTSGELAITQSTIIDGPVAHVVTISGADHTRVFAIVDVHAKVTISGLTISDGLADGNASGVKGFGGGILNLGDLTLKNTTVSHNRAVGAAGATLPVQGSGAAVIIGCGAGGGIANLGTLTVSHGTFLQNEARGASGCKSALPTGVAGDAAGGAIASFGFTPQGGPVPVALSVSDSQFSNNQAKGGDDNQSASLPGHTFGGAVSSHRFRGSANLTITHCRFEQNKSIGGNRNVGDGQNLAVAGGVSAIGMGLISDSTFDRNEANGGNGAKGSNGGDAGGGGIGVAYQGTVVTISKCAVKQNLAVGGQAGLGGNGGSAAGGGISNGATGKVLTITDTIIDSNQALGGKADSSGTASSGGDGLGGGLSTDPQSNTSVTGSKIIGNSVSGGKGTHGGSDGKGIGGGIYHLGTLTVNQSNVTDNHATTSNDNIYP